MLAEVEAGLAEAEGALLQLKRQRLLASLAPAAPAASAAPAAPAAPAVPPLATQPPPPPLVPGLAVGTAVRFRFTNGRRYFGTLDELLPPQFGGPVLASVSFAHPTAAWMRQPAVLPLSGLRPLPAGVPTLAPALLRRLGPGAALWVRPQGPQGYLWEAAELADPGDGGSAPLQVVLSASGRRLSCRLRDAAERVLAPAGSGSEEEQQGAARGGSSSDDSGDRHPASDDDGAQDGGVLEGPRFAAWEQHTNGVGSRILAALGYKPGGGLGRHGQGRSVPLSVRMRGAASTRGLGDGGDDARKLVDGPQASVGERKTRRGGAKARERKQSAAAREAAPQDHAAGMFGLLNRLPGNGLPGDGPPEPAARQERQPPAAAAAGGKRPAAAAGRQELLRHSESLASLRAQQQRYTEMLSRNQSDRTTAAAVGAKLTKIGKDIEAAERAHGAAASTLSSEAQIRKLMKF